MTQVGTMIFNDGYDSGYDSGYTVGEEHTTKRNICAYIKDSICDGQAKERILSKLQCIFEVDELQAREFYDEIAGKVN